MISNSESKLTLTVSRHWQPLSSSLHSSARSLSVPLIGSVSLSPQVCFTGTTAMAAPAPGLGTRQLGMIATAPRHGEYVALEHVHDPERPVRGRGREPCPRPEQALGWGTARHSRAAGAAESAMVGSAKTEADDLAAAVVDRCCCFRVSSFNFCFLVFLYSRAPLHRSHAGHLYSRISFRVDWSRGKRAFYFLNPNRNCPRWSESRLLATEEE
eukprot:762277-Rhodomonas_salina.1